MQIANPCVSSFYENSKRGFVKIAWNIWGERTIIFRAEYSRLHPRANTIIRVFSILTPSLPSMNKNRPDYVHLRRPSLDNGKDSRQSPIPVSSPLTGYPQSLNRILSHLSCSPATAALCYMSLSFIEFSFFCSITSQFITKPLRISISRTGFCTP